MSQHSHPQPSHCLYRRSVVIPGISRGEVLVNMRDTEYVDLNRVAFLPKDLLSHGADFESSSLL